MQQSPKLKPLHIVVIIAMLALTVVIFLFKDKITPDLNAPYRESFANYEKAEAVILDQRYNRGPRNRSRLISTIQFRDCNGDVHTYDLNDNTLDGKMKGDTVVIYYDPEEPQFEVKSEQVWREVMRQ